MNIHDPKDVIATMLSITHDPNDILIVVENETIIVSAPAHDYFSMRWRYPGYGNERVRQISKDYSRELMRVQKEQDASDGKLATEALQNDKVHDWDKVRKELVLEDFPKLNQEVEFTRMNGDITENVKGHVIKIDQDGIIEVHAFTRDCEGKFKYCLRLDQIHRPY